MVGIEIPTTRLQDASRSEISNHHHQSRMSAFATIANSGRRALSRNLFVTRPASLLRVAVVSPRNAAVPPGLQRYYAARPEDINPLEDAVVTPKGVTRSTLNSTATSPTSQPSSFSEGFTPGASADVSGEDWSRSFHGLSTQPFSSEISALLQAPIDPMDVEMKPGGPVVPIPTLPLGLHSFY